MENLSIYEREYNYTQVKAICEMFKYRDVIANVWGYNCDYEDIIEIALEYYEEWKQLADKKNYNKTEPIYNKIGNEIEFADFEEFAYEQNYFDRRVREDYIL